MRVAASGERARDALAERVRRLIDALADGSHDDARRDALLEELHAWQCVHVEAVGRIASAGLARGEREERARATLAPAVPTDVFRFTRVAAHPPEDDVRVFRTSGTTSGARGAHHLRDLSLYDRAAHAGARHALFPDITRMPLVLLAPSAGEAPDSSLSFMLSRFVEWFGAPGSTFAWRDGGLDVAALDAVLAEAERGGEPIALLGTSFAFVYADEALAARRFVLPARSRIMQTGGLKGRVREIGVDEQLDRLATRYGVSPAWIVQEYGMTELSSQFYETTLRDASLGRPARVRVLWAPGWVRASVVDPERLRPVASGEEGLLRVDDLANVDTACAIQTSDRAVARDGGVVVLGRASGAVPRGCSIAVDAALSGSSSTQVGEGEQRRTDPRA